MSKRGRLVYSSGPAGAPGGGDPGPRTGSEPESRDRGRHDVRVRRETGGRRGRTVTVAGPLFVPRDEADALSRRLKQLCGGGGTVVAGHAPDGAACFFLEVQGDHVVKVEAELRAAGFRSRAL
jgi:translation initiation factor 1